MSKTDLNAKFLRPKPTNKKEEKKNLAVNNDPAIVFGIMLGGFLHRVKLCKCRHGG